MLRPNGRADAPVVVVGDAPNWDEQDYGKSFTGHVGDIYKDLVNEAGFNLRDVVFVNGYSTRKTGKGSLTQQQIIEDAQCNLWPFLAAFPRKLVIALGNTALCATGLNEKPEKVNSKRGEVLWTGISDPDGVKLFDCPGVVSTSPFIVGKEPDEADDVLCDLVFGYRVYNGHYKPQVGVQIRDIEDPNDIQALIEDCKDGYPYLAYDHETDDNKPDFAITVSTSFCNGRMTGDDHNAWFWGGYDKLVPRFEKHVLTQFKEAFRELYLGAGEDYCLIAHNANFDDWVSERLTKTTLPGSSFDTMLMTWQVSNHTNNGLKENVHRYLGYSNYSRAVDEFFKEVKARRGRVLKPGTLEGDEDLWVLDYYGAKPREIVSKKTGKVSLKWPGKPHKDFPGEVILDSGKAGYALVDYQTLRLYNVYDAVYTRMLFDVLCQKIEQWGLEDAANLRHRIGKMLMRGEQRGFLLDVEQNRTMHTTAVKLEKTVAKQIVENAVQLGHDPTLEFNPRSNKDVVSLLFGEPTPVPYIDVESVFDGLKRGTYKPWEVRKRLHEFHEKHYGNFAELREAVKDGSYSFSVAADYLRSAFKKKFNMDADVTPESRYFQGHFYPLAYTKTGLPSVATAVLQSLHDQSGHPFMSLLLMDRKISKLRSTFVDAVYDQRYPDNTVHPRYNTIGTTSGRISSSRFNCQNFPGKMRGQLIARPGYTFVMWDLSQAEVRAVAAASGDKVLLEAIRAADAGEAPDIHSSVGAKMFGCSPFEISKDQRRAAKTIVFGLVYGMSVFRLALAIGVSVEEAQEFMDAFFGAFPEMKEWLDDQVKLAHKWPHMVRTPWGTMRSVRNVLSTDASVRSHAERIACNMPIQGAAGELTLYYICEIMDEVARRGWDVHMLNTTHDSCCLEVPVDMAWNTPVTSKDKDGNDQTKQLASGPVVGLVQEIIGRKAPVAPLDQVTFKADIEIGNYWDGAPDFMKAVDPEYGTEKEKFRWDLIRSEEILDKDELAELIEIEQVAMGLVS